MARWKPYFMGPTKGYMQLDCKVAKLDGYSHRHQFQRWRVSRDTNAFPPHCSLVCCDTPLVAFAIPKPCDRTRVSRRMAFAAFWPPAVTWIAKWSLLSFSLGEIAKLGFCDRKCDGSLVDHVRSTFGRQPFSIMKNLLSGCSMSSPHA
jgi:hypothetical protein